MVVVVVVGSGEEVQGSQEEEVDFGLESEGGGEVVVVVAVVVLGCDEDCVSFMNICMKAAISRSAGADSGWLGGVCVGVGVVAEGADTTVVEEGAAAGLSLKPEGVGVDDDEFQNQPMVMASSVCLGVVDNSRRYADGEHGADSLGEGWERGSEGRLLLVGGCPSRVFSSSGCPKGLQLQGAIRFSPALGRRQ